MFGVLVPVGAGKSRLTKDLGKLQASSGGSAKTVRFIDVDIYVQKRLADIAKTLTAPDAKSDVNWDLEVFPAIKDQLESDHKHFKSDRFVIVTSNARLLEFLKIQKRKAFLPSPRLFWDLMIKLLPLPGDSTSTTTSTIPASAGPSVTVTSDTVSPIATTTAAPDLKTAQDMFFSWSKFALDGKHKVYDSFAQLLQLVATEHGLQLPLVYGSV